MKNRGGFTILETIITLTVSSLLFITVMLIFNGRQGRVEFSQGLRDIQAYILDVANDVQDGYFPKLTNLNCSITNPGEPPTISYSATTSEQGTNNGCIFAGKVMYFDGASGSQTINTYSMAGRRDATNLVTTYPALISTVEAGNTYSALETYKMPAGIQLVDTRAEPVATAIAFFFDVSSTSASSGGISTVLPTGLSLGANDISGLANSVNNAFAGSKKDLKTLCFKSGTSNQYGTISINKGINGLTANLLIGQNNGTECAVQ